MKITDAKVINEENEMVKKFTEKFRDVDVTCLEENQQVWNQMKNDMKAVNIQLVKTNSTAIKNTTILETKLCKAKTIINNHVKTITEETELITILETGEMQSN